VFVAVGLAAVFALSGMSSGNAASTGSKAYSSPSGSPGAQTSAVPANCIRQACGKLWCWEMRGAKAGNR
jgi:hypothetical protein